VDTAEQRHPDPEPDHATRKQRGEVWLERQVGHHRRQGVLFLERGLAAQQPDRDASERFARQGSHAGPGLPGVARANGVLVSGNPALTSLSGLSALQTVQSLAVERNPRLVELPLPELQQADVVAIHANAALDDAALTALRQLPGASSVKIVSNLSGPAQLASCPWPGDGVCDELLGDCAAGSDAFDCGPTLRD
jgi:hypothetical protein